MQIISLGIRDREELPTPWLILFLESPLAPLPEKINTQDLQGRSSGISYLLQSCHAHKPLVLIKKRSCPPVRGTSRIYVALLPIWEERLPRRKVPGRGSGDYEKKAPGNQLPTLIEPFPSPHRAGTCQGLLDLLPSRLLGQHGHVGDHEALKLGPLLLPAVIHRIVVGQGCSKQDLAAQEGALQVFCRQALVHIPVELGVSHGQLQGACRGRDGCPSCSVGQLPPVLPSRSSCPPHHLTPF